MSLGVIRGVAEGERDRQADAFARRLADAHGPVHVFSPSAPRSSHPDVTWHHAEASSYPLFRYPPHDLAVADVIGRVAEDAELTSLYVLQLIPHLATALLARAVTPGAALSVVQVLWPEDVAWLGESSADVRMAKRLLAGVDEVAVSRADDVTAVSRLLGDTVKVRELDAWPGAVSTDMLGTD